MAFEEVRRWHSFAEDIALNSDVQGVIRDLYQRLSDEKHHGRTFASRALGYLAAGRYGLAEDEIIDILSQDREVMADFKRRSPKSPEVERLPVAVWSRFYFDIKPYLMERISEDTTLLAFYHLELHDVAKQDYLVKDNQGVKRHGALAEYFNKQAGPRAKGYQDEQRERDRWSGRPRSLSELPYHAAAAKMWDELFAVLTDFRFLENKAERVNVTELRDPRSGIVKAHGGAFNLQEDYERALAAYPASDQRKSLEAFSRCFNREIHNFRQRPDILWQQLYNRMQWADDSAYPEIISKLLGTEFDRRSRSKAEPWLHLVNPVLEPESLLRTIVGHTNHINACAFSPDGKRVVSGGHGGIIKVWEVTTGKELHDLTGKLYHVYGICFSPDGKYIVAGSQGRIEVLDLVTQESLLSIDNAGDVSSCIFRPPGGDVLAVATGDDSLKLWDIKTGKLLSTMKYHPHTYNPNGQLMILTKDDRRPSILNLDTSKRVVLEAYIMENPLQEEPWEHAWGVPWQRPYAFSSDGKVIAIISRLQNRVMVWATQTGHLLGNLEGQPLCLFACAAGPDGVLVLLALRTSDDLRLWNVTTGKLIRFTGHVKKISSCDFSPDRKLFVSASWDWTVKLWDIETGSRKYAQHNPPTLGETKARERLEQCMAEGWKRWCFVCCEEKSSYQVELNLILGGGLFGKDSVQNFTIRDIETGESITTEGGHPTSPVYSLALCPKKGILASVGLDRFLKIWDFRSGRNIATFPALAGLSRVDFIRDGLLIRCEEETQGRVYFLRLFGMEKQERCDCGNKILLWSYGEIGRLHGLYARHLVQVAQAGKITMKEFLRVSSLKDKLGIKIWYYDQLVRAAAWYMENLHQALLLENREEIERLISEHKSKAARNVRDRKGVATSLAIAAFLLDRKLGRHNAALELAQEAYGVSAKYGEVQLGRFIKPILELLRSKEQ
jgi:WD40 repeat protein